MIAGSQHIVPLYDQPEEQLIQRAIDGERGALDILLGRYDREVRNYVQRLFPQELQALIHPEDIVQCVWYEAIRCIRSFRPSGQRCFIRWLMTISRNEMQYALRWKRSPKHGGRIAHPASNDPAIVALEELALYKRTPSRSAAYHELIKAVEHALAGLPEHYRQAVSLHHIYGLTVGKVARKMGWSDDAAKKFCARGLR